MLHRSHRRWLFFLVVGLFVGRPLAPALAAEPAKKELPPIQPEKVQLGRPVSFQKDILPFLEDKCIACHNEVISESRLNLETVALMKKGGKRGPALVPGKPDQSLMYKLATRQMKPAMPPIPNDSDAAPLTPREAGLLRLWIEQGAPDDSPMSSEREIAWQSVPPSLQHVYSLALSPHKTVLAAGRANRVFLYDLINGRELARLRDPNLAKVTRDGRRLYPDDAAHRDIVNALAFHPNGTLLASGGYRIIKLWQRQPHGPLAEIKPTAEVTAAAATDDGNRLAIATADNKILLFDVAGKSTRTLAGHTDRVTGLDFSADGKQLVSVGRDKTVRTWNPLDGSLIATHTLPQPVSGCVLVREPLVLVTAHDDNVLRVWSEEILKPAPAASRQSAEKDAQNPKEAAAQPQPKPQRDLKGHSRPVRALRRHPKTAAQILSCSEDGTVRLWDVRNGRVLRTWNHGAPVADIAVLGDGSRLASAAANGTARLWDFNGRQLAELKGRIDAQRELDRLALAQTVESQRLNLADNALKQAEKDLKDREDALKKAQDAKKKADEALAAARKKADEAAAAAKKAQQAAAKNPKDKGLKQKADAAAKEAQKQADALKTAEQAATSARRALELSQQAVARAKEQLEKAKRAKAAQEERKKAADAALEAARKRLAESVKPLTAVTFLADGTALVTADETGTIQIWGPQNGQPIDAFEVGGRVGRLLATNGDNVWTVSGPAPLKQWRAFPDWKLAGHLGPPSSDGLDVRGSPIVDRVLALGFSHDGTRLACGSGEPSRSGQLIVWDWEKRQPVRVWEEAHSDTIFDVEFSWDDRQILSGGADKFAKIHDIASGKLVRSFEGHTHHVLGVAWSLDGSRIATAGADNVIKVWNAQTGEQIRTIGGFSKQVTAIDFIGPQLRTVSCSGDRTVRLHDTNNGGNYRNFGGSTDYVFCAVIAPDESIVAAGGADGVVRVWNAKNGQLLFSFEPPKPEPDATQASVSAK
ncbi:MAG: hypothetical protein D6725_10385 [Planctomycetota bacterium]|nr:MAG: hypothetical protein D6725_10385 [Planctomycetota bacterium]